MRPRVLLRDIAIVLCLKAVAILALFLGFFGPGNRLDPGGDSVRSHLLSPAALSFPSENRADGRS